MQGFITLSDATSYYNVYYKTLGTAFAATLKHLFYLETGVCFHAKYMYLRLQYGKLVRMGLKGVKEV